MKLYGSATSPFVRHCRIALIQGNLDFEFVSVDFVQSATQSPTKKVPFFEDGAIRLTDSCSIVKYAREKAGGVFFPDVTDYDLFCMANTGIDAAINLFLLTNEGFDIGESKYLTRQGKRVESALDALNEAVGANPSELTDGLIRVGCLVEWGLFRNRFDIDSRPNLQALLAMANQDAAFSGTAIPA